jgi:hypothetical protein
MKSQLGEPTIAARRIGFVIGSRATLKIPIMEIANLIANNH